jgi:HlyD family secretion protein
MKVRYLLVPALLLAVCGGGLWWAFGRTSTAITFRTATIEKKDVQKIVSATGTLTADPSVDVGTQVSGIVADILVDFNSEVEKGQVLARIDTSLLEADVASASARLVEAQASREQLTLALKRTTALHDRQAATDEELEAARADAASAEASVRSAQVTLDRARRNLGYATITAPITGTVVRRDVNRGQTVNAGFSAPVLFQIAGDLTHMMILAAVDESDVGQIKKDQTARFTVQAFPDKPFTGTVRQVRLQSKIDQSVVTYTTVIDVDNPDRVLFPGMTATVEFIVADAKDVLCVANGALRFSPEADVPVVGERPTEEKGPPASGNGGRGMGGSGGPPRRRPSAPRR